MGGQCQLSNIEPFGMETSVLHHLADNNCATLTILTFWMFFINLAVQSGLSLRFPQADHDLTGVTCTFIIEPPSYRKTVHVERGR